MEKESLVVEVPKKTNKVIFIIIITAAIIVLALVLGYLTYGYFKTPIEKTPLNETENAQTPAIGLNDTPETTIQTNATNATTEKKTISSSSGGGGGGGGNPSLNNGAGDESDGTTNNSCTIDSQCFNAINLCGTGLCNLTTKQCYTSYNSSKTLCRNNISECDAQEFCSGSSLFCMSDSNKTNGAACSSGTCNNGKCVIVSGKLYYVDKDRLLTGSCNNNWQGNITHPKCSVTSQNWIMYGLLPGDLLYFVGNESTDYGYMYILQNSSGTKEYPVIMRPYGDYTIKFKDVHGVRFYENASYIKMYNLEFVTYMALANNTGLEIFGCRVNATSDSGVRLVDAKDFALSDCIIHGRGYSQRSENIGVNIRGITNNLLFKNVEVYGINDGSSGPDNSDADGFSIGYGVARNVTFINCSSHHNGEDGFDLTADALLINCKAYSNDGAGIKVFRRVYGGYSMNTVTIVNSLIYNNGYFAPDPGQGNPGIKASGGGELKVFNSVIYGNWDEGIGIRGFNTTSDTAHSEIYNSIIASNGQEGIGVDQSTYPNPGFNNVTARNNIYFNNSDANNGLGSDMGSFNANPLFVEPGNNFRLQEGSPAIDNGTSLVLFNYDLEGTVRPQGNGWDIGVYEYVPEQNVSSSSCSADSDCTSRGPGFICNETNEQCEWLPPIGIPKPTFGIEETYRMYDNPANRNPNLIYYQNEEGGFYTHYVDNTHPNATDANNAYGTKEKPRKTVPYYDRKIIVLPEGSVVEIHSGDYTYGNPTGGYFNRWIYGNGTAQRPIFIRGMGNPLHTQMRIWISGNYIIIENITISNGTTGLHYTTPGSYISFRSLEIYGWPPPAPTSGIITSNTGIPNFHHNVVAYNNYIHDNGDCNWPVENDFQGVFAGGYSHHIWVLDNTMHHNSGDSVHINSEEPNLVDYVYVGRNIMHDEGENAIDIKESKNVIISENRVYNFDPYVSSDGTAIVVNDDFPHINTWIIFNDISNSTTGIRFQDSGNAVGNIIHDITGNAIVGWIDRNTTNIVSNIIYNTGRGIAHSTGYNNTAWNILNNIIANVSGQEIYLRDHMSIPDRSTIDYNIFFRPDGSSTRINWGLQNEEMYENLAQLQQRTSQCQNCIEADSLFVDPENNNFNLSLGSPAIDSGIESEVYQRFYDLYGIDIRKDIEGRTRPIDGDNNGSAEWDIGAYEYSSGIGGTSDGSVENAEEELHSENAIGTILNWFRGLLTGNTIKAITGYFLKIR